MTVDDTTLKATEIMAVISKAVGTTSPESYPSILAALGRYHQALADAGLLAREMRPTRTWRAVAPEGHIWCESSSEAEVRRHARPGDIVERLWATAVREEWRTEGDGRAEK